MTLIRTNQEIHGWPLDARNVETAFGDDARLQGIGFRSLRVIQAEGHTAWSRSAWAGP